MKAAKVVRLLAELAFLVGGLATGGPLDAQVRGIALVLAVVVGGAVLFVAACLCVALVHQRQGPYTKL